ncbi:hypothetical protein [Nocardia nova]|uniref:hypothetical protein n=1 Tax=Nocardia nova TaxID=37330 RepID=UPI0027381EF8|nr:hypothetical protein [Nocardia nova]
MTPVALIPPAVADAEVDNRVGSETSGHEQGHSPVGELSISELRERTGPASSALGRSVRRSGR